MKILIYLQLLVALLAHVQMGYSQISTFPYNQDFESFSNCFPNSCAGACPLPAASQWAQDPLDAGDWVVDSAGTSSGSTGPYTDHNPGSSSGKYLYLESSGCYNMTINLLSPVFDISVVSIFRMDFWYHMSGASMGTMHLDVSTNGGANWTNDVIPAWTDNIDLWQNKSLNLGVYSGTPDLQFRIRGITGATFTSDMAIDDFSITEILDNDASVASVLGEYTSVPLSQIDSIWTFMIRNIGLLPLTNIDVEWIIDDGVNPALIYTDFGYGPLIPGDTLYVNPSTLPSQAGTYTITATANTTPADQNLSNNTAMMVQLLSDNVYSRDNDNPVYAYGIGGIPGHIGNQFTIYNTAVLHQGLVRLGDPNTSGAIPPIGTDFTIRLHDFDELMGWPDTLIAETPIIHVTTTTPGQYHTMSFTQPPIMSPGEYVLSIYERPGNPNVAISACDTIYTSPKHWVQFATNWFAVNPAGWSTVTDGFARRFHKTPIVRMILDEGCLLAVAGVDDTLCVGESTMLGGNPTAALGTPPYIYSWTPSASLNDPTIPNPIATPTVTTVYTVTVMDELGCQESDTVVVVVNPLPDVIIIGLSSSYCVNDQGVNLTAAPATGTFSGPGVTDNPGMFVESYTGTPVNIPDSGIYVDANVTVAGLPGTQLGFDIKLEKVCFSITHSWVSELNIRIENPAGIQAMVYETLGCMNDNIDVCIFPGQDLGTMNGQCDSLSPAIHGDFNAVYGQELNSLNDGSNPNGTWKVSAFDSLLGNVGTIDSVDFYFTNNSAIFDPASAGVGIHTISFCYTDINGCESCEDRQVIVDVCTGINHVDHSIEFEIHPNPTNGSFEIRLQSDKPIGEVQIHIFNVLGKKIYSSSAEVGTSHLETIELDRFVDGLYLVTLTGENLNAIRKLVKY